MDSAIPVAASADPVAASRPARLLDLAGRVTHQIAALLLGALAIVVLLQVFSRYILHAPIDWTIDGATILLVWVSFLGAAAASFGRHHFALEFVTDALPARLARAASVVANMLVVVVLVELAYLGASFTISQMDQSYASAEFPKAWAAAAIPVSSALMIPRYLIDAVLEARRLLGLTGSARWEC